MLLNDIIDLFTSFDEFQFNRGKCSQFQFIKEEFNERSIEIEMDKDIASITMKRRIE